MVIQYVIESFHSYYQKELESFALLDGRNVKPVCIENIWNKDLKRYVLLKLMILDLEHPASQRSEFARWLIYFIPLNLKLRCSKQWSSLFP